MILRSSTLALAILATACGKTDGKAKGEAPPAADGGTDTGTDAGDEEPDERKITTQAAADQIKLGLAETGLAEAQIDAVIAAAQAKVDALPAEATPEQYMMAFAQGATQALNEALFADENIKSDADFDKAVTVVMGALMARVNQNVSLSAEDADKLEKAILEGSIAGMLHVDTLAALQTKLEGGAGLSLLGSAVCHVCGISAMNVANLDLETAMMAVQSQRADLLESQLKAQLDAVYKRNADIAALNQLMADLKAKRGLDDVGLWDSNMRPTALYNRAMAAGVTMSAVRHDMSREDKVKGFDNWIEQLKGKIDSLNSSQQMDMIRLQSLANKRNEAFDLMSNFIKKMADARSSILGNLRLAEDLDDTVLKTGRSFDVRMLTTIAVSYMRLTKDVDFARESLLRLWEMIATNVAVSDPATYLAEPLALAGEIVGRDIAALDAKSAKAMFQSIADGAFAGAIASFEDHELAVKLMTHVAVGVVNGIGKHKESTVLHTKIAAGYMTAFMVIAGKTPGSTQFPDVGNDKVRIAFGEFLQELQEALAAQPGVFDVYKAAVEAEIDDAAGSAKEILMYGVNQVTAP